LVRLMRADSYCDATPRTDAASAEGRVHQTLRVTPLMAAAVSDHVGSVDEVVVLLEAP
jgi:hypothetical protein